MRFASILALAFATTTFAAVTPARGGTSYILLSLCDPLN